MAHDIGAEDRTRGAEHAAWTRLLWNAASTRAGATQSAAPHRLLDGSPEELEQYAHELIGFGLTEVGELVLARAAQGYGARGERKPERDLWQQVAVGQTDRFDSRLDLSLTALQGVLEAAGHWRIAALRAATGWPEQGLGVLGPLREAVERAGPDEPVWAALLAEALVIGGLHDEAISATSATRAAAPTSGDIHRLRLELDVLEAIEERDGASAADAAWHDLFAEVEQSSDAAASALCWQRRAVVLVDRDRVDEAGCALLKAAEGWASSVSYGEVGEAWFAWRGALELSGGAFGIDRAELAVAAVIRHGKHVETEAARRLEAAGLRGRTVDELADARVLLWKAYVLRRRRGQLFDVVRILRELGHVHEHAGEMVAALSLFVACGAEAQAERTARVTSGMDVTRSLDLDGPRWERAAAYAALGVQGREAPEEFVHRWAEHVLAEAEEPWVSMISPQPALRARNALAALFCALPERLRERALHQLRDDALSGFAGTSREAGRALGMSMTLGWSDETPVLVDALLGEGQAFLGVALNTLAESLDRHPSRHAAVRAKALEGYPDALELLVMAGTHDDDEPVRTRCTEIAQAVGPTTIERSEHQVSVGMSSFEAAGIIGRIATPAARQALAANLTAIAGSDEEPLMNRVSAVNALFNLAPAIEHDSDRDHIVGRLARGEITASAWDRPDAAHPFSRMKFSTADSGELQAAALSLLGRWRQLGRGDVTTLAALVRSGGLTQHAAVVAAAIDVLARVPELEVLLPPGPLAEHSEARVRAALATLMVAPSRFDAAVAERLANDSEAGVRSRLLELDPADDECRRVLESLAHDRDAYIRARARRIISRP